MKNDFIAKATISIRTSVEKVWDALTNPHTIKKYMFGTTVISDWEVGSKIIWKGEWNGKTYEDKGVILQIRENEILQYSHFSPMTGLPDIPENYHTVTISLSVHNSTGISVNLTQNNNTTEHAKEHSESNWRMMLSELKKFLE